MRRTPEQIAALDRPAGERLRLLIARMPNDTARRLYVCDLVERCLKCERKDGREPNARVWQTIKAGRAFAKGKITSRAMQAAADAACGTVDATRSLTAHYAASLSILAAEDVDICNARIAADHRDNECPPHFWTYQGITSEAVEMAFDVACRRFAELARPGVCRDRERDWQIRRAVKYCKEGK